MHEPEVNQSGWKTINQEQVYQKKENEEEDLNMMVMLNKMESDPYSFAETNTYNK